MRSDAAMARRFDALWRRCVASPPSPDAASVYAQLRGLYASPDRHFHDFGHIAGCLVHLDRVASLLLHPDAVEMALWFHDAIYVPGAADNEERSAQMFLQLAAGARGLFRRRVQRLIMVTVHKCKVQGHDQRFMVDIDLAGFGASWDEFMRRGDALREEFAVLPDPEYYGGQIAFLTRLQRRRPFFATDYFRARYERAAQENLRRLLQLRHEQGYGVVAA
jgi:predicted metal-dependent HD superfamily phosphohydrolase